jgi:hypothetical protein
MSSAKNRLLRAIALGFPCLALSAPAHAAPVRYDFDSEAELTADGWSFHTSSTGTSTFSAGELTIDTIGYGEWLLMPDSEAPWFDASDASGWYVETRMRLDSAVDCSTAGGVGLWMNEGELLVKLHVNTNLATLSYPETLGIDMSTTDDFHVYRVQNLGHHHVQLLVDGRIVVDEPLISRTGGGSVALNFGDLGACQSSVSAWDYLEYDVVAAHDPYSSPQFSSSSGRKSVTAVEAAAEAPSPAASTVAATKLGVRASYRVALIVMYSFL